MIDIGLLEESIAIEMNIRTNEVESNLFDTFIPCWLRLIIGHHPFHGTEKLSNEKEFFSMNERSTHFIDFRSCVPTDYLRSQGTTESTIQACPTIDAVDVFH